MQQITPPVKSQRFRPLTVFLALCVSLVLVQRYLPKSIARTFPELPACVMLAALPHRRLPGENSVRAAGLAEAACPNTVLVPTAGFTLIELSIVLVIIGLIVGGVLTGRDLIGAATVRAQVTQIEKYNQAVNTFRGKYGYLPGDMIPGVTQQFGFTLGASCNGGPGARDGNGLLDTEFSLQEISASNLAFGEPAIFWNDISAAGFVEGTFNLASCNGLSPSLSQTQLLMPVAKINSGSYVYVYDYNEMNFFGVSTITSWAGGSERSSPSFTVAQAYAIDKKIDDGLPTSGRVLANFASGGGTCPQSITGDTCASSNTTTSGGTSSSCYDTTTGTYSVTVNNGSGTNCGISFQFQ